MKALYVILLLIMSNTFMTLAWYGHLKFSHLPRFRSLGLLPIIFISWGIALFEYMFQVPANRLGFKENGGPFSLLQLKVIQEVITLTVFVLFSIIVFKQQHFKPTQLISLVLIILAVYFAFK